MSKRNVPVTEAAGEDGQDVFVPWVLTSPTAPKKPKVRKRRRQGEQPEEVVQEELQEKQEAQVFKRYYHMFAKGELQRLVQEAAKELQLVIGRLDNQVEGVEIIQEGWERSNYYVEVRRWKT